MHKEQKADAGTAMHAYHAKGQGRATPVPHVLIPIYSLLPSQLKIGHIYEYFSGF